MVTYDVKELREAIISERDRVRQWFNEHSSGNASTFLDPAMILEWEYAQLLDRIDYAEKNGVSLEFVESVVDMSGNITLVITK